MAHVDPLVSVAPVARVAEPHQSTVTAILRAVEMGLFTTREADMMIDRVRAHLTPLAVVSPSSVAGGVAATKGGLAHSGWA